MGTLIKKHGFHKSYDPEWETYEVDEDQLLDYLEPHSGGSAPDPQDVDPDACEDARQVSDDDETRGGLLLDWHTCDAWPERWADLVIVLRCDHQLLWKRLEKRCVWHTNPAASTPRKRLPRTTRQRSWASSPRTRESRMRLSAS